MAIYFNNFVEPLSPVYPSLNKLSPIAESSASLRLESVLRRYVNGEISGHSYLVAGHRGSGKSTLIHHCIQRVMLDPDAVDPKHKEAPNFFDPRGGTQWRTLHRWGGSRK